MELLPQLDRRLQRLETTQPDLAAAAQLQARLIREGLNGPRPPQAQGFPMPRDRASNKLRLGTPLLHGEPVQVDVHFAADLFGRLLNVVGQQDDPELQTALAEITAAATDGRLDAERLFVEGFVQHDDHLAEIASGAGLDTDLLRTLVRLSVAPLLRAYAARLAPLLDQTDGGSPESAGWMSGYCFICGAWPLLAELRGVELKRYLRCGACGSGWPVRQIFCPYCGLDDHRQLVTLRADGQPRFRTDVCERCRGYVKGTNAFEAVPGELLPLEDLASLHLDLAAMERGYQRPPGTGFRLELAVPESAWGEELAELMER